MSTTFVGGKLKLKGGVDPTQLKGGVKKKKKKSKEKAAAEETALAVVPADGSEAPASGGEGGDQQQVRGVLRFDVGSVEWAGLFKGAGGRVPGSKKPEA